MTRSRLSGSLVAQNHTKGPENQPVSPHQGHTISTSRQCLSIVTNSHAQPTSIPNPILSSNPHRDPSEGQLETGHGNGLPPFGGTLPVEPRDPNTWDPGPDDRATLSSNPPFLRGVETQTRAVVGNASNIERISGSIPQSRTPRPATCPQTHEDTKSAVKKECQVLILDTPPFRRKGKWPSALRSTTIASATHTPDRHASRTLPRCTQPTSAGASLGTGWDRWPCI